MVPNRGGKFLIPGLWDMHARGASDSRAAWSPGARGRSSGNASSNLANVEFQSGSGVRPDASPADASQSVRLRRIPGHPDEKPRVDKESGWPCPGKTGDDLLEIPPRPVVSAPTANLTMMTR